MEGAVSVVLKHQARKVAPHLAYKSGHQFIAATASLREENELVVVAFNEDRGNVTTKHVWKHKDEVWSLAPSHKDAGLVCTGHHSSTRHAATLWRMPGVTGGSEDGGDDDEASTPVLARAAAPPAPADLEQLVALPDHAGIVHSILWSPDGSSLLTGDSHTVRQWSLAGAGGALMQEGAVAAPAEMHAMAWDPHNANEVSVSADAHVNQWDVRTLKPTKVIANAHSQCVRAVSYNPNKPRYIATGGDDGLLKFWDLRKPDAAVAVLAGHSHWVWSVAYNPFHDQLVLSSGSDGEAILWRASSISSVPLLEMDDEEGTAGDKVAPDGLVARIEDHEDSVYSVAWSAYNAWAFASLSYTGKLAICTVPSAEKYKILL